MRTRSSFVPNVWMAALVLIGLAASVRVASACTCMSSGPPCQAAWQADAVFAANVVSIDAPVDEGAKDGMRWPMRRVRVKVTEGFRNTPAAEVDVLTGMGGGDCGYNFAVGGDYLIYAYRRPADGRLTAGICSRTRPIKDAEDDLRYLRGTAKQAATGLGRLFGVVRRLDPGADGLSSERPPLAGVSVIARTDDRSYRTETRADGSYEMSVLAGTYRVTLQLPDELYIYGPQTGAVQDLRACAEVAFLAQWNGRVAGRVLNAAGDPVSGFAVELQPVSLSRDAGFSPQFESRTDADGRYEISRVPPGAYHLGSDIWRTGTRGRERTRGPEGLQVFLTDETSAPRVVEVGRGNRIEAAAFILPERLALAEVSGVVLGPNGAPASAVKIYVKNDSDEMHDLPPPAITAADGRFSMTVIAGRRYRLTAEGYENGRYSSRAELRGIETADHVKGLVLELKPLR